MRAAPFAPAALTAAAAFVALAALPAAAAPTTYRWVDAAGRVHYTDQPPQSAQGVEEKRFQANRADTVPAYAVRRAAADFPVTLYTAATCTTPCATARQFLAARGIPFAEKAVASDSDLAAYRQRFGAPDEVPALAVGELTTKGFEAGRWNGLLDQAGYPKTALPRE